MIKFKKRLTHNKSVITFCYLPKTVKNVFKHTVFSKYINHVVIKMDLKNVQAKLLDEPALNIYFEKVKIYATITSRSLNGENLPCPKIGSCINPYPQDYLHHTGVILPSKHFLNQIITKNSQPVDSVTDQNGDPYYNSDQIMSNDSLKKIYADLLLNLNYKTVNKDLLMILSADEYEDYDESSDD